MRLINNFNIHYNVTKRLFFKNKNFVLNMKFEKFSVSFFVGSEEATMHGKILEYCFF